MVLRVVGHGKAASKPALRLHSASASGSLCIVWSASIAHNMRGGVCDVWERRHDDPAPVSQPVNALSHYRTIALMRQQREILGYVLLGECAAPGVVAATVAAAGCNQLRVERSLHSSAPARTRPASYSMSHSGEASHGERNGASIGSVGAFMKDSRVYP